MTAGRYSVFCLPGDEVWVKQGLGDAKADSLPTTRPADILNNIPPKRDAIAQGLANDLGIEQAKVSAMLTEQLLPGLQKLDTLQPPVVFFVTTEEKIKSLIKSNWKHPRINYNQMIDRLSFDETVRLSTDGPFDEALMNALYDPTDNPTKRIKKLRDAAGKFESDVAFSVAGRARVVVQVTLAQFVEQQVFRDLKLRDDQSWLQMGICTLFAAKYAPMLTGTDPQQTLADMIYERQDAAIKSNEINLLELPDLGQILPEFQRPYIEAARRKSTLSVQKLIEKGGPEAIKKALATIKKNPPKDGQSLVMLVAGATDVDLSKELRPGSN